MGDALPDPARSRPARRPGRPAQLSQDKIVEAAASFANLDELTMRELANRLEVRHGALYRWVKNRDAVFDLVSETLVDRILDPERRDGDPSGWRPELTRLAWLIHDEFLAVRGFASHLSRPHTHNAHSVDRLRAVGVDLFIRAGVTAKVAEHSWSVFIIALVGWLASEENRVSPEHEPPAFELFLGVLVRGLPVQNS